MCTSLYNASYPLGHSMFFTLKLPCGMGNKDMDGDKDMDMNGDKSHQTAYAGKVALNG